MSRIFHVCDEVGTKLLCTVSAEDSSQMLTSMGNKRADLLVPMVASEFMFPGVDINGDVLVKSFFGGEPGNQLRVAFTIGPVGAGNENLALRVDLQGSAPEWEVTVLFATDGAGTSVTPIATDVANLLNTDPTVIMVVEATLPGSGASDVISSALMTLAGGVNTGDWLKFDGHAPKCRQIARAEAV